MNTLSRRLERLEATDSDHAKQLPDVVPDTTTDAELARLRKHGREVYRFADFIERCMKGWDDNTERTTRQAGDTGKP